MIIDFENDKFLVNVEWYVALCFLYSFESNCPKDYEVISHIISLEEIINNRLNSSSIKIDLIKN